MNIICLFIFVLIFSSTKQFDLETCRSPLGIETGKIFDSAFSSSSHNGINSTAAKARIRSENNGWCPVHKISTTTYEYLQIDLVNLTVITLIELQGKFSQQPNEYYADSFRIEYRRDSKQKWIKYKDFSGQYILSGNTNSYIPTIRDILPSLVAKQIRIIPIVTGLKAKHICMRLELYGCSYQDAPISYSIPQGDKRGYEVQFIDETYDGHYDNGTLIDGLGQLTDGILAGDDYRLADNIQGIGQIGYDWIGWKRKSSTSSNINLIFYFDSIRNITSIRFHTSNLFTRDIYLFNSIIITNCDNSISSSSSSSFFLIPDDYINTQARFINISLASGHGIITKCLKVTLTFNNRSKWILISEVLFDSAPINNIIPSLTMTTPDTNHIPPLIDYGITIIHYWQWLLLASSLFILLVILTICVYFQWIQTFRHRRKLRKMTTHLKFQTNYQPISLKFPSRAGMNCCYTTVCDSTMGSDGNSTCSTSHNDMRRHLIISTATSPRAISGSDFGTSSTASPATMSTIYQSIVNPYLTAVKNDSVNVTPNPYASIDTYAYPIVGSDKIINPDNSTVNIQGPCGNCTYQSLSTINNSLTTPLIPRIGDEQLIIEERYSTMHGHFGQIVRGYIYLRHPYNILKSILIKALTTNDLTQKELFDREHELLIRLNHPNLVQFFGYTVKQTYALIEHSDLGDLYTFLSTTQCVKQDQISLSINVHLFIITQISNALRYLESENILHRDISARNCLIYPNYEIKLTNTAIASLQFQTHYYNINQHRLPIRWMSPEAILNNEFTSQSDIWSFGITLWEIMTNCLTLPYALLNDEQVYQRLKLMGTNLNQSSGSLQLSKPECLSRELVDLMLECWRPYGERPTFNEIFNFFNKRLDERSTAQFVTVSCYECINCTDPFSTSTATVTSNCNSCYKLAINVAYAPYRYVVRRCLAACLETTQSFGGGQIVTTCCAKNYCNGSSMIKFPTSSRLLLFIFIILNFLKYFY
ncbi:unnamed protein product [Adineta steineri]|uniref:Uncharacterized protein n=1 Tax=Adineta steineri TaxID=433720 RepID=A0A813YLF0_9BILA|nr:unnamed protein product [Adineta steineri]CAF1158851.1 unnamed protein product [Adineta steineri]